MSEELGFLAQIGIKLPDLVAGFAGGVVNSFALKRSDPLSIIGSMVVGALTANYLSEVIGRYTGTSGGTAAFLVGLAGMALCQGIVEGAKSWRPFGNNRTNTDANRPLP